VVYLITEANNFSAEKMKSISERYGLNTKMVLNTIAVTQISGYGTPVYIMQNLFAILFEERCVLLVIDSVNHLFNGRSVTDNRQETIGKFIKYCKMLAMEF